MRREIAIAPGVASGVARTDEQRIAWLRLIRNERSGPATLALNVQVGTMSPSMTAHAAQGAERRPLNGASCMTSMRRGVAPALLASDALRIDKRSCIAS
jgi:hypothetical protein